MEVCGLMSAQSTPGLRIIVIGSRFRPAVDVTSVLDRYTNATSEIITGGSTGADAAARAWAREHGVHCTVHEPDWSMDGPQAILERNTSMVNDGADICLAFPMHQSFGTQDCVDKASAAGIPTTVVFPAQCIQRRTSSCNVEVMPEDDGLLSLTSKYLKQRYQDALAGERPSGQ